MTSSPSPPNRRRRRLVVAVAVLVVVTAISWWYWPRGDARFVGKWRVHNHGDQGGDTFLTLRANGNALMDISPVFRTWCRWHIEKDRIAFGYVPYWVSFHVEAWTGVELATDGGPMNIVEVSRDKIILRSDVPGKEATLTLTRLPE